MTEASAFPAWPNLPRLAEDTPDVTPAMIAYANSLIEALNEEMHTQRRFLTLAESERDKMLAATNAQRKAHHAQKARRAIESYEESRGRSERIVQKIRTLGDDEPGIVELVIAPGNWSLIDGTTRIGAQNVLPSEEREEEK